MILIEDCAHAFFGQVNGRPLGDYGDYAVASVRKFLPVFDGGYLLSSRHSLADVKLSSAGLRYQLKAIINIIEEAGAYRRLNGLYQILQLPSLLSRLKNRNSHQQTYWMHLNLKIQIP